MNTQKAGIPKYFTAEEGEDHWVFCYYRNATRSGLWKADNTIISTIPVFFCQLVLVIFFSRLFKLLLKPLHQPRIVSDILAGVVLGSSGLGRKDGPVAMFLFPFSSVLTMETLANYGLAYFMFLVGLDLDFTPMKRASAKALGVAFAGLILPIPVGMGLFYFALNKGKQPKPSDQANHGPLFCGICLAATNFHDLLRILADIKLIHSTIGRTALSAAVITDLGTWVLLVIAMATANKGYAYGVIFIFVFVMICVLVLRPAAKWVVRHTMKDDEYTNYHLSFALIGVMLCGTISDACGAHSLLGAFMWGVVLPRGELRNLIKEKTETFVSGILMPFFFLTIGLRANVGLTLHEVNLGKILMVVTSAFTTKTVCTFLVGLFCNMPPRESLALGLLMNTKGWLTFLILSTGYDTRALTQPVFTLMLFACWLMTAGVGPIVSWMYHSSRRSKRHKCRNVQSIRPGAEFRILACVHSQRNVPGFIGVLRLSNPSKESPIRVFAIHLVELVGRASAMLIVHGQSDSKSAKSGAHNDGILNGFETLADDSSDVVVHSLTAVSSYASMHDDICELAEEKRVTFILMPFHKHSPVDGGQATEDTLVGNVNKNVLDKAPCSVGLLVDRGSCSSAGTDSIRSGRMIKRVAVFFVGGPDDREALAYAVRISRQQSVEVTVTRFVASKEAEETEPPVNGDDIGALMAEIVNIEKEKTLDEDFMRQFMIELENNPAILYSEKVVNNGEETVGAMSSMEHNFDLYIVGRGKGQLFQLVRGLLEFSDYPELGPLGDALASSTFSADAPVLVIQQGDMVSGEGKEEGPGQVKEQFGHSTWQPAPKNDGDFEPFVNRRDRGGEEDDRNGQEFF